MSSITTNNRIRRIAGLAFTAQACVLSLSAQQVIALYPGEIPNSIPHSVKEVVEERNGQFSGYRGATHPTLEIVLPKNANKPTAAVVICPGGGYVRQVYRREGTEIAQVFAEQGVAAFILKYRIPNDATMADKSIGALQDAQQAIRLVR